MDGNTTRSKAGLCTVTRITLAIPTSCDGGFGSKEGINIVETIINNIKYADDTVLLADMEEKLQNLVVDTD